jgi:IBR domain, a half RING-finger domain
MNLNTNIDTIIKINVPIYAITQAANYCPAPGCNRIVEYQKRDKTRIITCDCGAKWCCKFSFLFLFSFFHLKHLYNVQHNAL